MKTLKTGYGNSGNLIEELGRILNDPKIKSPYIVSKTSGVTQGTTVGGFSYEICGTGNLKEIMKPEFFRKGITVTRKKDKKMLDRKELARDYLELLSQKDRFVLINALLLEYLTR